MARSRRKDRNKDKTGTYLTVIVACVAIVALVVLVLNSGQKEVVVVAEETIEISGEDAALAGEVYKATVPVTAATPTTADIWKTYWDNTYRPRIYDDMVAREDECVSHWKINSDLLNNAKFFAVSVDNTSCVIAIVNQDGKIVDPIGNEIDYGVILG